MKLFLLFLTFTFGFISCGKIVGENLKDKKQSTRNIKKKEFDIKMLIHASGGKYEYGYKYYYEVGFQDEVYFVSGDRPIVKIKGWDLVIYEDSVQFVEAQNPNKPEKPYYLDKGLDIFNVTVFETGDACDDTRAHKVIIENASSKSEIKSLAHVKVFKNCIGKKQELYIVSYHHCIMANLKIYRVRK